MYRYHQFYMQIDVFSHYVGNTSTCKRHMKYFRKDSSRKILPQAPQRLGGLSKFSLRL